jgi:hypothetical protein
MSFNLGDDRVTIKDQLGDIYSIYSTWCTGQGVGKVFICSDMYHLWAQLFNNEQAFKILVMYNGEVQRVNFPGGAITGRVDRKFLTVVSRGRGLAVVDRGLPLVSDYQNARPLFDIVDELRDLTRAIFFDPQWCERPMDYVGIRPFNTEGSGMIIDAYQIDYSVGTQLMMIAPGDTSQVVNQ